MTTTIRRGQTHMPEDGARLTQLPLEDEPLGNLEMVSSRRWVSVIWFLVRVIPKPSRATYPARRPLPVGRSLCRLGLGPGSLAAGRRLRRCRSRGGTSCLGFAVLILIVGGIVVVGLHSDTQSANMVGPGRCRSTLVESYGAGDPDVPPDDRAATGGR